jgi:ribosomal protein S18 acetylase RimI-like enzyme
MTTTTFTRPAMNIAADLHDRTVVTIRPITPSDTDALVAYLEGLSDRSRYFRFLQATPRIGRRLLEVFTPGDAGQRVVLVAVRDGVIVGEAMMGMGAVDREADVAYSVAEAFRRQGLARTLLTLLLGIARERGIEWLRADILGENRASVGLLQQFGARIHFEDGLLAARLDVSAAVDGWSHEGPMLTMAS